MSRWSDLDAAKAAAWIAKGHAALMRRATVLLPRIDADSANELRAAMLSGDTARLLALVSAANLRLA